MSLMAFLPISRFSPYNILITEAVKQEAFEKAPLPS